MKAQTTLEFIGSALFFILGILAVFGLASNQIPQFYDDAETTQKNLEAKQLTDNMLISENSVGPNISNGFMTLNKTYLENEIGTAGDGIYNSTQFTSDLGLQYRYNIQITRFPIVQTSNEFVRGSSPAYLTEPSNPDYSVAQNIVKYGNLSISGSQEQFLVTASDGSYEALYHQDDGSWDFSGSTRLDEGDSIQTTNSGELTIESIQNRPDSPGSAIVLSKPIKFGDNRNYFGSNQNTTQGEVIKISRYPLLEDKDGEEEISKMEVLVW